MNIINDTLEPNNFYHIYNRGINGCEIFKNEENYHFFLNKFSEYLKDFVEVFGYCLMTNHFHFIVKIKSFENSLIVENKTFENGLHASDAIVSKQFGKFISSYTQSYNKTYNRHGSLMESPFKRKRIENEEYLKNLILYVHLNPEVLKQSYKNYKFSSYQAILSNLKTNVMRKEILELFEGKENFVFVHQNPPKVNFKF